MLSKEDPLPGAKVEATVGHRNHNLAPHDLALEVSVGVVLTRAVVLVLARGRVRGQFLQPLLIVVVQPPLVVVDEHAGRNVHRIYQHKSLLHAAFPYSLFHLAGDVDQFAALASVESKVFGVKFHSFISPRQVCLVLDMSCVVNLAVS